MPIISIMKFVDAQIGTCLSDIAAKTQQRLWIVSPFLTDGGTGPVLEARRRGVDVRVITRLNDADILAGVLDPVALAQLIATGVRIRFHDETLHAKIWITDHHVAIGSANITRNAFERNFETMLLVPNDTWSAACGSAASWFDFLWNTLDGTERTAEQLSNLATRMQNHWARPRFNDIASRNDLNDYGKRSHQVEYLSELTIQARRSMRSRNTLSQAACLLLGRTAQTRARPSDPLGEIWARYHCCWNFPPRLGKPNLFAGDRLILSELAYKPDGKPDRVIVGRAIVLRDYNDHDGWVRPWVYDYPWLPDHVKADLRRWERVIWLRDVQALGGTVANGLYLSDLVRPNGEPIINPPPKTQNPRRWLSKDELSHIDEAFERKLGIHPGGGSWEPIFTWWSLFIEDESKRITRDMALAHQAPNLHVKE